VIKETVEKGVMLARQLVGLGRKTETERESANINDFTGWSSYSREWDAMPEGDNILLLTRLVPGALLRQRLVQAEAEHYVCISVADTGVGMKAEVRRRVFESFFTTKKSSRGSGLGLTIVYRIVAEHAGFIEATSEPGCGSTFHIYLPVL
jgi:signal transduction histidine kinase